MHNKNHKILIRTTKLLRKNAFSVCFWNKKHKQSHWTCRFVYLGFW